MLTEGTGSFINSANRATFSNNIFLADSFCSPSARAANAKQAAFLNLGS